MTTPSDLSAADRDAILRRMEADGIGYAEIAVACERSVSWVTRRASALDLPTRRGDRRRQRAESAELDRRCAAMRSQGVPYRKIAGVLGLPVRALQVRMTRMRGRAKREATESSVQAAAKPPAPTRVAAAKPVLAHRERPCMCCSRPFRSSGPGHRLCYGCKGQSGVEDYSMRGGGE